MSRARKMTAREREQIERTITALLDSCVREHGELWPSSNDFAEAHGVYRTVRDLNFEDADAMWYRLQKAAAAKAEARKG